MRKTILLVFLAIFQLTIAQTEVATPLVTVNALLNAYEVPSPNQSSFNKVNFIPVSNYTGRSNVTIPLYEVVSGDIKVPITLSYNTSGVKVNDVPSFVGSNWSLNAGGKVTKTIKGLEDFSYRAETTPDPHAEINPLVVDRLGWSFLEEYSSNPSLNDLLGDTAPFAIPPNSGGVINDPISNRITKTDDMMPDVYNVSASEVFAKFVHTKEGVPFEIGQTGNKIESTFGISDPINLYGFQDGWEGSRGIRCVRSINITNPQGLEYQFDKLDISQSADITSPRSYERRQKYVAYSYNKVDAYNLSSITSPTTLREVNFNYETYRFEVEDVRVVDYYKLYGHDLDNRPVPNPIINQEQLFRDKYPQLQRLRQISFDLGTVDFVYDIARMDLIGDEALEYIIIKDKQGQEIKKFKFEYSYFIADTNCDEAKCKRLKLDRIRIFGREGNEIPGYEFEYDTKQLPERDTFNLDFLGYANAPTSNLIGGSPKLYFSEGKGDLSLFPVKLDNSYMELPGVFSMEANLEYTKAGILESITYPTGAKTQFAYELNTFLIGDREIRGAGLRIKSQRIYDKDGGQQIMDYRYVDFDDKTSGRMNDTPLYGRAKIGICDEYDGDLNKLEFDIFLNSQSQAELTDGAYVGYSRVLVKNRFDNGLTEYIYSNAEDQPDLDATVYQLPQSQYGEKTTELSSCQVDFFKRNGGFNDITIDQGLFRGRLKREQVFDQEGTLLSKKEFTFSEATFATMPLLYIKKEADIISVKGPVQTRNYSQEIDLISQRYMPKSETTTMYYDGDKKKTTVSTQEYHPTLPFVKTKYNINSIGHKIQQNFYYTSDKSELTGLSSEELSAVDQLVTENRISRPLRVEEYYENTLQKTSQTTYKDWGDFVAVKSEQYAKGNYPLEDRILYLAYDDNANPISLSGSDGTPMTYLYGYDNVFPIAKLENLLLSDIASTTISNLKTLADNDANQQSENTLRQSLDALRTAHPNAHVTTYTHDPLIGVTSITDPSGEYMFYEYDEFNRLEVIRDLNNKILKEFCYGYREGNNPCGTNAPDGVFINVTTDVEYNVPIANALSIPEYDWDEIDNEFYKSLHPVFYFPRVTLIHPNAPPTVRTTPIPDFYNLPYPEFAYSSGWEARRKGISYELVGLDVDHNQIDTKWSLIVNGIKVPLNWKIPELNNVIFPPMCFSGKQAILICDVSYKDESYTLESIPFTLKSGLGLQDNQEFSNSLFIGDTPKTTSELCEITDVLPSDAVDENTPWEDTTWDIPINPDTDENPTSPTDPDIVIDPNLNIQLSNYLEYEVPIPNNLLVPEYSWEGVPNNRKSLHPFFYFPRPNFPVTGNENPPINVGLYDKLPYPYEYYNSGWYAKRGGYRASISGLQTIDYPHLVQWVLRIDGNDENLIRIPESSTLFYVPRALDGKEGKVVCKIIKQTGEDAGSVVEAHSETVLFQSGLKSDDNPSPALPLGSIIFGN